MRYLPVFATVSILFGAGVIHGLHTDRWGAKVDLEGAAARLGDVPMTVGDWEGQPMEMNTRQLAIAEAAGWLSRRYVNRRTGVETSVVVLCGRPGPISVHSPEVCYPGSGFVADGDREVCSVSDVRGGAPGDFFKTQFTKAGPVPETLNVYWGYKTNGPWTAASNPRIAYAPYSILYKLYVIRRPSEADEKLAQEPCLDFLRVFLPELDKYTLASK